MGIVTKQKDHTIPPSDLVFSVDVFDGRMVLVFAILNGFQVPDTV